MALPLPSTPISFVSTDTLDGGYSLSLVLLITDNAVAGHATVTQATNPPLNVNVPVAGTISAMTVMPNNTHYLLVLNQPSGWVGRTVNVRAVLDATLETGTANVSVFLDTPSGTREFTTQIKQEPVSA
jgi:hypothetical protein